MGVTFLDEEEVLGPLFESVVVISKNGIVDLVERWIFVPRGAGALLSPEVANKTDAKCLIEVALLVPLAAPKALFLLPDWVSFSSAVGKVSPVGRRGKWRDCYLL